MPVSFMVFNIELFTEELSMYYIQTVIPFIPAYEFTQLMVAISLKMTESFQATNIPKVTASVHFIAQ